MIWYKHVFQYEYDLVCFVCVYTMLVGYDWAATTRIVLRTANTFLHSRFWKMFDVKV